MRGHALDLLANLDARLRRIEAELGLSAGEAEEFRAVMAHIRREARRIHAGQIAAGIHDGRANTAVSCPDISPGSSATYSL